MTAWAAWHPIRPPRTTDTRHPAFFSKRDGKRWIWSVWIAISLNAAFFWVMPHLIAPTPSALVMEACLPHIQVIRMKTPESKVEKKTEKPPEPPVKKEVHPPSKAAGQPMAAKLTLSFEIHPRLPGGPTTLELPPFIPSADAWQGSATGTEIGAAGMGVFTVSELDAPLTVLTRIPPVYPMRAKQRGIEGWVNVKLLVEKDGRVSQVEILAAEPQGIFEESVHRCVIGWRFKAGTVKGVAVKAWVETTIRFELEG